MKVIWKDPEYELRLTYAKRRKAVVISLYRHGGLVKSGEIRLARLIVGAGVELSDLQEDVVAEAQLVGTIPARGWKPKESGHEADPPEITDAIHELIHGFWPLT